MKMTVKHLEEIEQHLGSLRALTEKTIKESERAATEHLLLELTAANTAALQKLTTAVKEVREDVDKHLRSLDHIKLGGKRI